MDVVSALERSYEQTAKLVADLGAAQLDAPSPCAGWDVRATLNHLLGATWMFTLVNQGHAAGEDAGDVVGDDPGLAVTAAAKENLASWRQPEAFEGDRAYPFGTFPAHFASLINLEEVVVHNWDIAKAAGIELMIDEDIAQLVYDWATTTPLDDFRAHGAFGPEIAVPASASTVDRMLALLGREPTATIDDLTEPSSSSNAARAGRATMDHARTMRSTYERISAGDIAGFGDLVADDFVEHQGGPGLPPTKEGTLEFFRILLIAFPDMRMEVEDLIASGDKAVARVTVTATHHGEFMGVQPTGRRAQVQLIDIMRFDDAGLVCEHWGVTDMLSLMQQLGVVPAGPPA